MDATKSTKTTRECVSACFFCGSHCGAILTLDQNDRILKVVGDKRNPHSKGYLCSKGVGMRDVLDSPHRLTQPLKRIDGKLEEIPWEQAFREIGAELARIRREHAARSIGFALGGSMHTNLQALAGFLMLKGLGTRTAYGPPGLEFSGRYLVNQELYGSIHMDGHPDYEHTKYAIIMGSNPCVSKPIEARKLKALGEDPGRSLVVVDPRRSETAALADIHAQLRPSTDIYLLLAMLNLIISEELYDKDHVAKHSVGFEEIWPRVQRFTPRFVARATGLQEEVIAQIARGFGAAESAVLFYEMGVAANRHSTLASWAVQTLLFITNNIDKRGGSIIKPNPIDFDDPSEPGKSRVRASGHDEIGGFLPATTLQDDILMPGPGRIRAMIVSGSNPVRGFTNAEKMDRAFADLELVVSIDPFLTEVGRVADYVLPACCFQEQENISFAIQWMYETPRIQLVQKIRDPLGDSLPEWEIYRGIMKYAGRKHVSYYLAQAAFGAFAWAQRLRRRPGGSNQQEALAKLIARLSGTNWGELERNPHGFDRSYKKPYHYLENLRTEDKKVHLAVPKLLAGIERLPERPSHTDARHPLVLCTTCRTPANVNTLMRDETWQRRNQNENALIVHPKDTSPLGVSDGDTVRLFTRTNDAEVKIRISEDARPGSVFLSHGWGLKSRDKNSEAMLGGVAASTFLPDDEGDEFTGLPFFNGVPCRIEKVEGAEG